MFDFWNCDGVSFFFLGWFKKFYFLRLCWFGLLKNLKFGIVVVLVEVCFFLYVFIDGVELGYMFFGEMEVIVCEEEDEFERWMRDVSF